MKKILTIFLIVIFILTIMIIGILLIDKILTLDDNRILKGYYKKDDYSEPHAYRDYADYYKYYYDYTYDLNFQNSKMYAKVNNSDIEELKSYFAKFRELMDAGGRLSNYDFNESIIDENDYFIIYNRVDSNKRISRKKFDYFDVFLYDTGSHILYVIQVDM